MKVTPLAIHDLLLIEPKVFEDSRGFFFESFNLKEFSKATLLDVTFVQDNHSKSSKGVLRGLHYQLPPYAQGKLIRVIQGEIFDVTVDLRKSSPTFGKHVSQILSAENNKQIWIPQGFAHGFLTLSDSAEILYKTTDFYYPESECCIIWDDPDLGIRWPNNLNIQLSPRDVLGLKLKFCKLFD
jgi:dTDP-4-dehydrorhamnose 3,5-epimerase